MKRRTATGLSLAAGLALTGAALTVAGPSMAQPTAEQIEMMKAARNGGGDDSKPDFPDFDKVSEGYTKVVSSLDEKTMYTLYRRDKDGQLLAELPPNFENQRVYIGYTVAAGIPTAGIQFSETYVYWKRYDDKLALIEPQLGTRTTGDFESRQSAEQLFTDRVLLSVPIKTMGPGGGPVIDMDGLLLGKASDFFGRAARGLQTDLGRIVKAKAFPQNMTISLEAPDASGQLITLAYSMSILPEKTGYEPREADPRIGYFGTAFFDLAKVEKNEGWTRYINRWKLEKAEPSLSKSPPKEPIVFYLDHKTPVRYRRWVRDGVLEWNKAYEQVGIVNAVEVYQQDSRTGAHMDKDPEDVRYNFIVWNSNNASFAIGPSRVDPRTGQILDADVVMNDGWLRFAASQFEQNLGDEAIEGFSPETLAWLDTRPQWDPRVRLAAPERRDTILKQRSARLAREQAELLASEHAHHEPRLTTLGQNEFDGLANRSVQMNGHCSYAYDRGMDLAMVRSSLIDLPGFEDSDIVDGAPEEFIGGVVKDVVMHEVGHVIGLRHNFKASTIYTLDEINSDEWREKNLPITGSVMDYNAMNYSNDGEIGAGPYFMTTLGPYDLWAIEYGYTFEKDLDPILARVSEDELPYLTDEDTWGPDPMARRRDMGKDVLNFIDVEMELVQNLREDILDKVYEEGESWQEVRSAYMSLFFRHVRAVGNAANWVGGVHVNRDRMGDPGDRNPTVPVDAEKQRRALKQVIEYTFYDDAYGLTPELLNKMSLDKWWDGGGFTTIGNDPQLGVHDMIVGVQAAAMTQLLNPTKLRRVYDNEFRIPAGDDAVTLPELLETISASVWGELDGRISDHFTAREPMISSLRRSLQSEHLDRLIDLTLPSGAVNGAAGKPISNLAGHHLRQIHTKVDDTLKKANSKIDPYTLAHLEEAKTRIERALDAQYIYNSDDLGSGGGPITITFGSEP